MSTKLHIGFCRKETANFQSTGAEVALDVEIDAILLSDSAALTRKIHELQEIARAAVDDELAAQHQRQPPARDHDREPEHRRPQSPANRMNGNGNGRDHNGAGAAVAPPPRREERRAEKGAPRSGKGLYAWAKEQEEHGFRGVLSALTRWGKHEGLPDRFFEWSEAEVRDGYEAIRAEIDKNQN